MEIYYLSLWQASFAGCGPLYAGTSYAGGNLLAGTDGAGNGYLLGLDDEGNILWEQNYPEAEVIRDIYKTAAGEFILAGRDDSGGDWVSKVDSAGNIIWSRGYGGDEFRAIAGGIDGGYILAGSKNYNGFAVRIDSFGNLEWSTSMEFPNYFEAILSTVDGGYLLAGEDEVVKLVPAMSSGIPLSATSLT